MPCMSGHHAPRARACAIHASVRQARDGTRAHDGRGRSRLAGMSLDHHDAVMHHSAATVAAAAAATAAAAARASALCEPGATHIWLASSQAMNLWNTHTHVNGVRTCEVCTVIAQQVHVASIA